METDIDDSLKDSKKHIYMKYYRKNNKLKDVDKMEEETDDEETNKKFY